MTAAAVKKRFRVGDVEVGPDKLFLIAGPCVIESRRLCLDIARHLADLCSKLDIPLIFKASYDKANRSSASSYRGPGMERGLEILQEVRETVKVPVLSDVHETAEVSLAAAALDVLQIPAFLCRQTDLIQAAARSGKPVNVKKGQMIAPWDARNIVEKVLEAGGREMMLTERGTCFGYNNLVSDMRAIPVLRQLGCPVVFDATHSAQLPGAGGKSSGGQREMVPILARAAVAAGCDGLFLEVHPDPEKALSDGPNSLRMADLKKLLGEAKAIRKAII